MKSSIGINWQYGLMVNMSELAFAAFMEPELQRQVLRARMAEPGLVLNPAGCGNMGLAWRVEQVVAGGDLLIRVDKGVPWAGNPVIAGVMSDGEAFAIEIDLALASYLQLSDITVPDDGVWRTLTVTRATTKYEPGIATFTASSLTVTGVGTYFTRLSGRTMDGATVLTPGDKIYVTSGANAGEVYEVDNVVSDTEIELTAIAIADQDAAIVVAGTWYLNDVPTNPQAHNNPSYTIELQSGVVTLAPADYLIIADVMLDTGSNPKIQIIDRRMANMFRLKPDARAMMRCATLAVSMAVASCNDTVITDPTYYQQMVAETRRAFSDPGGGYDVFWTTIAPASNGVDVLAVSSAFGDYLRVSKYTANTTLWSGGTAGGVQPDSSGDVKASHLQLLPPQSGNTHTLVYQINGATTIYQRRTPDDGATWSSQSAIINDPDLVDAPTPVILTRSGRMWVFYPFNDGSTFYGIRAVYSDTYGNSWDTNGGQGYEVLTRTYSGTDFIAPQDATETDDGQIALLCADRGGLVSPVMTVLLTESTLSPLWDDGGDVASAPVGGPDTVRLYDKIGTAVYRFDSTYQNSAIQALPGQSFGIISYILDPSGGTEENLKTWATVVSAGNARVDPTLTDRRTLEVLDHTELNWISDAYAFVGVAISARIMPGGEMMVVTRRSWQHQVYDSIKVRVCETVRSLTFQPACFGDLNP